MNVACAVSSMSDDYRRWYKDLSIIGHEDNVPSNLDLLILTGGGADISPERYRMGYEGASGVDTERDCREFNILSKVLRSNPGVKVLGVCRGLQVINVFFGGDLIQDMYSAECSHSTVHSIVHKDGESPFSWLGKVNSLHHQAIKHTGCDGSLYPHVVALEPITSIAEIVSWGNDLLGVQFHPEMFADNPGDRFFSVINSWVNGNISLFKDPVIVDRYEEEDNSEEDLEPDMENMDIDDSDNDGDLGVI